MVQHCLKGGRGGGVCFRVVNYFIECAVHILNFSPYYKLELVKLATTTMDVLCPCQIILPLNPIPSPSAQPPPPSLYIFSTPVALSRLLSQCLSRHNSVQLSNYKVIPLPSLTPPPPLPHSSSPLPHSSLPLPHSSPPLPQVSGSSRGTREDSRPEVDRFVYCTAGGEIEEE